MPMNMLAADLHIHSCLSPCADDDMTPANIAAMGAVLGLRILALTDHNSCGNCEPFLTCCERYGILGIPGMELTTAEEIHLVCLFPTVNAAQAFSNRLPPMTIRNNKRIFGSQLYMDAEDEILGEEELLLTFAREISIGRAASLVEELGGISYPAHINRPANSIVSILGTVPETLPFRVFELSNAEAEERMRREYPLQGKRAVISSDAHTLAGMCAPEEHTMVPELPESPDEARLAFLRWLKGACV